MDEKFKRDWADMFRELIELHRRYEPDDTRTDLELMPVIAETLFQLGLIGRTETGKYILPELVD